MSILYYKHKRSQKAYSRVVISVPYVYITFGDFSMSEPQQHTVPSEPQKKRRLAKRLTIVAFTLLLIAAAGGCIFWYRQYHRVLAKSPDNQQKQWTNELSELIVAPNEQPLITTVIDKTKLTNATLAHEAKNGDRLYIFAKSHRIVLYRPSDGKVVDMLTIQEK